MKYIGKPFICYGHPFRVDPGILRILAETGLFEVWTGIQSASERVRSGFLGRMKSNVDIFEYTGLLHKFYIMPRYEIIADNPFETEEDNRSAIEFLSRLKHPYNMHFYSLCYFAKTGLTQQALERGIIKSHELEQFTSKSINSFFMFLVKSKNKDDLYWNCLKAIAVNPYISKRYLKYCLNNIFFRIYPSCLLFLTRLYMRAVRFARSVILKKRRVIPFVIAGLQPEHVKLSNYIYFAGQKSLKFEKRADFMLFPEPIEAEGHGFCFKVENHLARSLSLQFFFEVHPFHVKEVGEKATWRWCVSVEALEKKILSLRFSYPHCLITHGQKSFEGKIIEKCLDTIDDDRTYILKIKYKVRFQQNPLEVARVLFSGKGNIPSFLKGPEE